MVRLIHCWNFFQKIIRWLTEYRLKCSRFMYGVKVSYQLDDKRKREKDALIEELKKNIKKYDSRIY